MALAVIFVVIRVRGIPLGRAKILKLQATCTRFLKLESALEAVNVPGSYMKLTVHVVNGSLDLNRPYWWSSCSTSIREWQITIDAGEE